MRIILPKFGIVVEKWKWNKEYRVFVSTLGHFKDEYKRNLPIKTSSTGYTMIKTCCGYKNVHRVVMLTWRPIPDAENLTVDHLNHNKRDNRVANLEWVTKEENKRRASEDHLLIKEPFSVTIEKSIKNALYKYADGKVGTFDNVVAYIYENRTKAERKILTVELIQKGVRKAIVGKSNAYKGISIEKM